MKNSLKYSVPPCCQRPMNQGNVIIRKISTPSQSLILTISLKFLSTIRKARVLRPGIANPINPFV
jgi:hypothetical protein